MNLRRTDIKRIMESKAFKNVVDRHVNESDRYNVTEKICRLVWQESSNLK